MANITQEMNFKFHLILINVNINLSSRIWFVDHIGQHKLSMSKVKILGVVK